ncbi:MAG: hypothetical protein ACOH5I_18220 [Oligoflexus sp.]
MTLSKEKKLDEALEESFPASDPLPTGNTDDKPPENIGKKHNDEDKKDKGKLPHSA